MEKNEFRFTYKAPTEDERREIADIRRQYTAKGTEETKLDRLRKLDNYVNNFSVIVSLVIGVVGTLIFGTGLSAILLNWSIALGIILCILGFVVAICAYPVYIKTLNYNKNKYGDEILKLSEELLNEKNEDTVE
ncbi:MAG: hypothetical protein IJW54_01795 [Clostridia bacterium]|nr:hypothetical protein [Clostridia bacterium]